MKKNIVPPPETVNMMWSGDLTSMERMCIGSFIRHGYRVELYTYNDLTGVPAGTVIRDASTVVPQDYVANFQNPQNFSDYFRYCLLARTGGWWMDCDVYCLRQMHFPTDYVFGLAGTDPELYYAGMMRVPAGSELMRDAANYVFTIDTMATSYQHIGPELLSRLVQEKGLRRYVYPTEVFDPTRCWNVSRLVDPIYDCDLSKSMTVHLGNAAWESGPQSQFQPVRLMKHARYPVDCLYERMRSGLAYPPVSAPDPNFPPPKLGLRRYSLTGVSDWHDRYKP
jgi:hypothetical protein